MSDFKKDRTLIEFPSDIEELADQLTIKKFSVMGVSGGGPYAAVCAFKIPKRLLKVGIVVGLAPTWIPGLLEGTSFIARFCWSQYGKFSLLRKSASLFQFLISSYSPGFGIHRFLWGAKTDKRIYDDPAVRLSAQKNYKEAFRQGYRGVELDLKLYTTDWGFSIKDITSKVYLWYGADDKNVSLNMGKFYHAQIPNSKLIIYPGEGHLISRTHIEEILEVFAK